MSTTEVEAKTKKLEAFELSTLVSDTGPLRMVLRAELAPVAGLDRFQPTGFPEIGHVIYKAPRKNGETEHVCIVDSSASMANHLEAVCRCAPHDPDVVPELAGMPYLRCVTDPGWPDHESEMNNSKPREVVVSSLTEGHRIASTYFLGGRQLGGNGKAGDTTFEAEFRTECGILNLGKKAHAPPDAWWTVFSTIFKYDPNALVHGVLFPQWNVKIPRVLTAHLEAFGAARVDRSGVKFDRLGKTTSGQPIFAVDDATSREIRATFILDLALLRSFGREGKTNEGKANTRGLTNTQKEFLLALALWKIGRILGGPFRYRSGCDLECVGAKWNDEDVKEALRKVDIGTAISKASFRSEHASKQPICTDIYWPASELYREGGNQKGEGGNDAATAGDDDDAGEDSDEPQSED
jgi:CRISPR-associated protein Csb1